MNESDDSIDWLKTTFEGNRREQLRARIMTVRQRLVHSMN